MKRILTLLIVMTSMAMTLCATRIAILSDLHVSPGNANESKLLDAIAEINADHYDAVLVTGDLTNQGADLELSNVHQLLARITHPQYVIPGNHENNWSQSACKTWNDLWGNDRFLFTVDSIVVVGMNCGPFMKMGDGHIKQEDLLWLDRSLREAVKPGMQVLSVNHYPLLDDLDNYRDYIAVLKKYPVITHQNGHYHAWKQYETDGIIGIMVRALDMRDGNYGYSIMDIDRSRQFIKVYNKQLGNAPELKYAYKINTTFDNNQPALEPADTSIPRCDIRLVLADEASIFTRVSTDNNNVYYGNSLGYVTACDKRTGDKRWQVKTEAMLFSRPAVSNGRVVMPTADKRLLWLDAKSGKVLYSHNADGPYVADGVIDNGTLYQGGYNTFEAWDIKRHKLLWHYDSINNYCQAAPVVSGNDVIFGAWDTWLRCLDRRSGTLRWQWSNGSHHNLYSPGNVVPVVTDDHVVIVAPDRVTTCIDRRSGEQLWRVKNDNRVRESLGRNSDGTVAYAKTMGGNIVAMSTGNEYELLWKTDAGFGYEHAPCIILEHKGLIFAGSRRGMLAVIDANTHQLLGRYRLGSSEVNGFDPDPTTGDIYCSLIEGKIYRITVH